MIWLEIDDSMRFDNSCLYHVHQSPKKPSSHFESAVAAIVAAWQLSATSTSCPTKSSSAYVQYERGFRPLSGTCQAHKWSKRWNLGSKFPHALTTLQSLRCQNTINQRGASPTTPDLLDGFLRQVRPFVRDCSVELLAQELRRCDNPTIGCALPLCQLQGELANVSCCSGLGLEFWPPSRRP